MGKNNLKEKNGVVIMLDALGARDYSLKEAKAFIRHKNELKIMLDDQCNELLDSIKSGCEVENEKIEKPGIITFGDTIIIYVSAPGGNAEILIGSLPILINGIVPFGLKKNIFWRGAVGVGPYFVGDETENTILGPAVKDAASWYEAADWIGIIGTPRLGLMYEKKSLINKSLGYQDMIKYKVPIKAGRPLELFAVNWVYRFVEIFNVATIHNTRKEYDEVYRNGRYKLLKVLSENQIHKGVENKYLNTLDYYRWCVERNAEEMQYT